MRRRLFNSLPLSMLGVAAAAAITGALPTLTPGRSQHKKAYGTPVGAPPMPEGPTRCACGSGKRPKKCCNRKSKLS